MTVSLTDTTTPYAPYPKTSSISYLSSRLKVLLCIFVVFRYIEQGPPVFDIEYGPISAAFEDFLLAFSIFSNDMGIVSSY